MVILLLVLFIPPDFGSLSTQQLMDKIKHLQNLAYQVGLEEGKKLQPSLLPSLAKEMTRGKFLNIL
ncbi:protein lin-52 homolog, partial [Clonorchis sinensis]